MRVLSLFDGMACGRIALERAGIHVETYYASEIAQDSIKVAMKNYPDIIQLGDVRNITGEDLGKIDLLIGGSPCQNLSRLMADRPAQRKGLQGEKSQLFYEFLRIKEIVKPTYYVLENVDGIEEEDMKLITELLGDDPYLIDSGLVSAQQRMRNYWTNIKVEEMPTGGEGLVLKDIMEMNVSDKYFYTKTFDVPDMEKRVCTQLHIKTYEMLRRVYNPNYKAPTLTAVTGGYQEKKVLDNGRVRKLTPIEYERLQTVPEGYTEGVSDSSRYTMLGNGWTVDVIAHIFKYIN